MKALTHNPLTLFGAVRPKKYHVVTSRSRKSDDGSGNEEKVLLRFADREPLHTRFFIPVSKEDKVYFDDSNNAWVHLERCDDVQVLPAWKWETSLRVNGKNIAVTIKEIEEQHELKAYRTLTQFHYRGNGGAGRRIPLIAKIKIANLPQPEVVGFVELSSSMIVGVARKKLMNKDFHDLQTDYKWSQWDYDTAKRYTNAVVRISRCVVYPELRGVGLAAILAKAAVNFAEERWHVGGLRPIFVEIIAEMLRYWPFVEKVGFVQIGETEGNVARAPKAMEYLLTRKENEEGYPKGGGGIMSMHRMHAAKLAKMQEERNWSVAQVIELLKRPSHELSIRDWVELHDIHRPQKPVYMLGITRCAKQHLKEHMQTLPTQQRSETLALVRAGVVAKVTDMRITASVQPQDTARCREIQEAFGIVSRKITTELMRDFSVTFTAGEIVLVNGASGAGKSLFLRALRYALQGKQNGMPHRVIAKWQVDTPKIKVAYLQTPPKNQSPIELLKHLSLDDAMKFLAQAGLAEADLFVRPAYALSVGQAYRLSLAIAFSRNPDLILIDEFCEPLDEYTSAVICRKLRKMTTATGCVAVVATADARYIAAELKPNRTLHLLAGGRHRWINNTR